MSNFRNAKDLHFDRLKLDKPGMEWDPNSIYARDARLGLCMHCHYEGTDDVDRRPSRQGMPYCEYCMTYHFSIGTERLERVKAFEVKKWFHD